MCIHLTRQYHALLAPTVLPLGLLQKNLFLKNQPSLFPLLRANLTARQESKLNAAPPGVLMPQVIFAWLNLSTQLKLFYNLTCSFTLRVYITKSMFMVKMGRNINKHWNIDPVLYMDKDRPIVLFPYVSELGAVEIAVEGEVDVL